MPIPRRRPASPLLLTLLIASALSACDSEESPAGPTTGVLVIVRAVDIESGTNLNGIQVTVVGGSQDGLAASSESDQVPLQLRTGDVTLRVTVTGYQPVTQRLRVAAAATITVPLSARVVRLSGRVTDAQTGEAVAGATVTVSSGASAGRTIVTDDSGLYSFADLRLGSSTILAERMGYTATGRDTTLSSDATDFDIAMPRRRTTLAGRISLTGGTASVPTALEIVDGLDRGRSARADASGSYALGQVYWGTFRVRLSSSCHDTVESTVTISHDDSALGGTLTQNYSLPVRGFTISGTVMEMPFNRVSVGALVRLFRGDNGALVTSATSDGTGRVTFSGMCGNFFTRTDKSDFRTQETQIQRVFNSVDAVMTLQWTTYDVRLSGGLREAQALVSVTGGLYSGTSTSFGAFRDNCDCSEAQISIRGPSTIRISKPGFQSQTLTVDVQRPTSLSITFVPSS